MRLLNLMKAGCLAVATSAACPIDAAPASISVPEFHGGADHSGLFVMRGLDTAKAASTKLDVRFDGRVEGHIVAQPLYWRPEQAAHCLIVVATDANVVAALDAQSGEKIWTRTLGSVAWPQIPCGKIGPIGLHGTPVIDQKHGALYLDTVVDDQGTTRHMVFGISLKDGSSLSGWPIRVTDGLRHLKVDFDDRAQEQFGALTMLGDRLYVPFGGYGDCGPYKGRVIEVDTKHAAITAAWSTRGNLGGIWAAGGISSDGQALFFATGNTLGAAGWADGDAVFRLAPGFAPGADAPQSFSPDNWKNLDEKDEDLGGTAPAIVDLPSGPHPHLLLALGKDGKAYLLDRSHLGGIGGALAVFPASDRAIISATATYDSGTSVYVVVQAHGRSCADDDGVLALRISGDAKPTVEAAWCNYLNGKGAPIVTLDDASGSTIVWIVGAGGDNRLHAFRGDTGAEIFSSSPLPPIRRHTTILAVDAEHHLFLAAGNKIISFAIAP